MPCRPPLVSALMPAFCHERYVEAAIRSLMAQTYDNLELIIVDDGSDDGTWARIQAMRKECEARFARLVLAQTAHAGACATFQHCAELAQGEYLFIIASDDLAFPWTIACEAGFLASHADHVLVVGDNIAITADGQPAFLDRAGRPTLDEKKAAFRSFSDMLQKKNPHVEFHGPSFGSHETLLGGNYIPNGYLIRHDAFDRAGGYTSAAPLEDWSLMLRLARLGRFGYLNLPLFQYRLHEANTSKNIPLMREKGRQTLAFERRAQAPAPRPGLAAWGRVAGWALALAALFFVVDAPTRMKLLKRVTRAAMSGHKETP